MKYVELNKIFNSDRELMDRFDMLARINREKLEEGAATADSGCPWGIAAKAYIMNYDDLQSGEVELSNALKELGIKEEDLYWKPNKNFDMVFGRLSVLEVINRCMDYAIEG